MTDTLVTIRDFVRYAVSRFGAADLTYGHGTATALDEAAFLTLESLHLPIDDLNPWWEARLTAAERQHLLALIEARVTTRQPAAYLVNKAYLQGMPFYVDERAIVPRSFIAEILCDDDSYNPVEDLDEVASVLDLCTGSGCLAILAAHLFPQARVDAVDVSADALAVARRNVDAHELNDRVTLYDGDLFAPVAGKAYDLILANPPYVDADGMAVLPPEYRHEPRMALASGADGLDIIRRILARAMTHLNPGGGLLCEVGRGRAAVEAAFPDLPFLWLDTVESIGEVFWLTKDGNA